MVRVNLFETCVQLPPATITEIVEVIGLNLAFVTALAAMTAVVIYVLLA